MPLSRPAPEREFCRERADIAMVFQHFNLFHNMTALGNVMEAPVVVRRISREQAAKRALTALKMVGLEDKVDAYPAQLSGGQQQRVAIARAVAMEPKLMLFDEPTSMLDPELVGEVLGVMRNLAKTGMTTVVVTHELQFAREACDNLVFMDQGKVIEVGPPNEVLGAPKSERTKEFLRRLG
jgi:polar amino acid transport system ATP-binding protein